tara:strand:+ start:207 stop:1058 length:852 start_codon:yes stop_codon:yes gene_type:complete
MNQIFHYFHIIRPLNVMISGATVFIAAYLLNELNNCLTLSIVLIVMLYCAAANILNDLSDIDTDKINKPNRSTIVLHNTHFNKQVLYIAYLFIILGSIISVLDFSLYANLFLLFITCIIFLYTPILKGIPLIGNIFISFILSSVFIFTEIVLTNQFYNLLYPSILTFLLTMIREIIKDIADINGDRDSGIKTWPVVFGIPSTKYLLLILTFLLLIVSTYPYYIKLYHFNYFILLVFFVQIPLVGCIFYLWKHSNSIACVRLSIVTKYITIAGVMTILSIKFLA